MVIIIYIHNYLLFIQTYKIEVKSIILSLSPIIIIFFLFQYHQKKPKFILLLSINNFHFKTPKLIYILSLFIDLKSLI